MTLFVSVPVQTTGQSTRDSEGFASFDDSDRFETFLFMQDDRVPQKDPNPLASIPLQLASSSLGGALGGMILGAGGALVGGWGGVEGGAATGIVVGASLTAYLLGNRRTPGRGEFIPSLLGAAFGILVPVMKEGDFHANDGSTLIAISLSAIGATAGYQLSALMKKEKHRPSNALDRLQVRTSLNSDRRGIVTIGFVF